MECNGMDSNVSWLLTILPKSERCAFRADDQWRLTVDLQSWVHCRSKDSYIKGAVQDLRPWALFYHLLTSKWVVKFLVFRTAPLGSYGPAKMTKFFPHEACFQAKSMGKLLKFQNMKSGAELNVFFFSHFNRVQMSKATPSDFVFFTFQSVPIDIALKRA